MRRLPQGLTIAELARRLGARLRRGDPERRIHALASLGAAGADDLSFLASARHAAQARQTGAGAVLAPAALAGEVAAGSALIEVEDAHRAFGQIAREMAALLAHPIARGVHPAAIVAPGASLGSEVSIGPFVVVAEGARIGDGSVLEAGVSVGAGTVIGTGCRLHPRVTIEHDCTIGNDCTVFAGTVVGADGFGFAGTPQGWEKIPQLGAVVIGNSVEIGANCTIDRGALEDTVIGDGCKLDNLIQIGHNCRIGAHTAMAGCTGVAGSTRIGRHCTAGGSAMILGHLEIADHVHISAATVVSRSIRKPGHYSGFFPIDENAAWEKNAATLRQLHALRERIRALEKKS